ncbi:hypothetical protein KNP414_07100 [Paenibacillus mucilaginosus KNP414]|uniref:Uncharacterized protein n=1 Tax=Paenibacillus mucilaginosus (strain KNP414) TaxID=1036673 RepID=F8FKL7_PAEMK|nr:hypothetical protein KNP414_07100 [Paenibacillus mucilaginosus KNP414]
MKTMGFSELLSMIGSLFILSIWIRLYWRQRNKIYLVISIITLAANIFMYKQLGVTKEGIIEYFSGIVNAIDLFGP